MGVTWFTVSIYYLGIIYEWYQLYKRYGFRGANLP